MRIAVKNAVSTSAAMAPNAANSVSASAPSATNHLMQFDKTRPLSDVVGELCAHWRIAGDKSDFALKFEATKEYVTERNKGDVKDGSVLKLCQSPKKIVGDILGILQSPEQQMRLNAFKALQGESLLQCPYSVTHNCLL